jgi:hypothetical protein
MAQPRTLEEAKALLAARTASQPAVALREGFSSYPSVRVTEKTPGNLVEVSRFKPGKVVVAVTGTNNLIVIEPGVTFAKGSIQIAGHNNLVWLGGPSRLAGTFNICGSHSMVVVGHGAHFTSAATVLTAQEDHVGIVLGEKCLIGNTIMRTSDSHAIFDNETGRRLNQARSVFLEDRVWVAAGAMILKGVTVGHDTVVGARSMVVRDLPAHCVAVGTPARPVRTGTRWTEERVEVERESNSSTFSSNLDESRSSETPARLDEPARPDGSSSS